MLDKIILGLLTILSDSILELESTFVQVSVVGGADLSRGTSSACVVTNTTATLTGCGQSLSNWIAFGTNIGVAVLSKMVSGLRL